jgi:type III secretion protein T
MQVMDTLRFFFQLFDREILAILLTLPRLHAFFTTSQLLAATAVPRLARTGAILALSFPVIPINYTAVDAFDRSVGSLALLFAKEYLIGFLLGYVVGWVFWTVQAAGGLVDNQRGAAIASSIDPLQGHESSPLGNLFSQVFLTYVFVVGAALPIIGIVYQSYAVWPAARLLPGFTEAFPAAFLALFDQAMRFAFILAAPLVVIMFAAEFALALVSRFAPQIQVFILAMPIKSALVVFILIFYFAVLIPHATNLLGQSSQRWPELFELMAPKSAPGGAAP